MLKILPFFIIILPVIAAFFLKKPMKETQNNKPIIIGHRGAPGYLPDHTLESYKLAIEQGADFVEPDLVMTKDSFLVCRHEPMLSQTTNVSILPQFQSRKRIMEIDGIKVEDWFVCDFTLAEIKTLKAVQPMQERPQKYNGLYSIPRFEEVIQLVNEESVKKGRTVGLYPETKHPTFHESLGLPITDKLLDILSKNNLNTSEAAIYIQSFEVSNLQYIRKQSTVKLVQLLSASGIDKEGNLLMNAPDGKPYDFVISGDPRTYQDLISDDGLEFIKTYATGIGPWKAYIQPYTFTNRNSDGKADDLNKDGEVNESDFTKLPPSDLIQRAHKIGLLVHPFTFRNESKRLLKDYGGDPIKEYKHFYKLSVDGVFSDFPGTAVEARDK